MVEGAFSIGAPQHEPCQPQQSKWPLDADSGEEEVFVKRRNRKNIDRETEDNSETEDDRHRHVSERKRKRKIYDKGKMKSKIKAFVVNSSDERNSKGVQPRENVLSANNCFGVVTYIDKETYYRSNIQGAMTKMNTLEFDEEHIRVIKKTPFWSLFDAIYKKGSDVFHKRCHKYEDDIRQIVKTFDVDHKKFIIGGELVPLINIDAELIFGITGGDLPINLRTDKYEAPDWLKHCFGSRLSDKTIKFVLYRNLIFEKIQEIMDSPGNESIQDCARLVQYCYLLASIFAPLQNGSIAWQLSGFLEDFNQICDYDWSTFVVKMLKLQLATSLTMKAGGCAIILPYWLCEHTKIVKRSMQLAYPRFLNWDMNELHKVLSRVQLSRIPKVNKSKLHRTPSEEEVLQELKFFRDSTHFGPANKIGDSVDLGNREGSIEERIGEMATAPTSEALTCDAENLRDDTDSPTKDLFESGTGLVTPISNQSRASELQIDTPLFSLGITQTCDSLKVGDDVGLVGASECVGFDTGAQDCHGGVADEQLHSKIVALNLEVEQLKQEMEDERKKFEGALKIKVDLISELRCENSELLKRLAVFYEGPTTTQLYESQAVMAQLELSEKVSRPQNYRTNFSKHFTRVRVLSNKSFERKP